MYRSNWDTVLIRVLFIALISALAAIFRPFGLSIPLAAVCGVCAGLGATSIEMRIRGAALHSIAGGVLGTLVGGALGLLFVLVLNEAAYAEGGTLQFFRLSVPLAGVYLGLVVGVAKSDLLDLGRLGVTAIERDAFSRAKILDTSVLIDGRISDIAEAGFLEGKFVIPQFVLHELQCVADSPDSAKRNRGRRGLDVVQSLQKISRIQVEILSHDFPSTRGVDLKLIELAKLQNSKLVTNDFNLNKLAQVQGIAVLNINELANALKAVVLPGEAMRVFILKEGKEHNQGVAYLDDGTMVVVDHAKRLVSKTVEITVTSVLQTTAGKMIFGRYERLQGSSDDRPADANLPVSTLSGMSSVTAGGGSRKAAAVPL
ncbi:MAG: PIN/TRAM domain-containing protein [Bryobacteraceae bacterium]